MPVSIMLIQKHVTIMQTTDIVRPSISTSISKAAIFIFIYAVALSLYEVMVNLC